MSRLPSFKDCLDSVDNESLVVLDKLLREEKQLKEQGQRAIAERDNLSALLARTGALNAQLLPAAYRNAILSQPSALNALLSQQSSMEGAAGYLSSQLQGTKQMVSPSRPLSMPFKPPIVKNQKYVNSPMSASTQTSNILGSLDSLQKHYSPSFGISKKNVNDGRRLNASSGMPNLPRGRMKSNGCKKGEGPAVSNENESQSNVRRYKVEEALRSEPQRGRKREDLTDEEWIELTRMRNREHAKSNRLRKKARYAELQESEEELIQLKKSLQESDLLEKERKECFQQFVSVRQAMLNDDAAHNPENLSATNKGGDCDGQDFERSLKEIIVDPVEIFRLRIAGSNFIDNNDTVPPSDVSSIVLKFNNLDRNIRSRVNQEAKLDGSSSTSTTTSDSQFVYEIKGGLDGIGLSKDGSGFAQLNLFLCKTTANVNRSMENVAGVVKQRSVMLEGTLRVKFANGSKKLSSATWTVHTSHQNLCSNGGNGDLVF